jgi:uncharacterized FlaG/YvyC family protein
MTDFGIGSSGNWSYATELRRDGGSTQRETPADNRTEANVTAKAVEEASRSGTDRGDDGLDLPGADRQVRFERDAEIGALLFQVINTRNDEVVFQLPTEVMLNLRKFYAETPPPPGEPSFQAAL